MKNKNYIYDDFKLSIFFKKGNKDLDSDIFLVPCYNQYDKVDLYLSCSHNDLLSNGVKLDNIEKKKYFRLKINTLNDLKIKLNKNKKRNQRKYF